MRRAALDPRTVARDIPGLFEGIFPQLTPGLVAHLNGMSEVVVGCAPLTSEDLETSRVSQPMLFELGLVAGEQMLLGQGVNWSACLEEAVRRQRRFFDAREPEALTAIDRELILILARNLCCGVRFVNANGDMVLAPKIRGFEWISSSTGDISIGSCLVEVKCGARNFSSADYRQVLIYWILSYLSSIERSGIEWSSIALLNPRRGRIVQLSSDDILSNAALGASKADIVNQFITVVGTRDTTA